MCVELKAMEVREPTCILVVHNLWSLILIKTSVRAVPEKFWALYRVSQDPSDSKSNRLHVHIFRFDFIHLRYIL